LELRDDPEVAATAANAPEEVGVLVLARLDELAVRGNQVDGEQLVDGQAVLAHHPADAAAERQAGQAGVRDDPGWNGKAELLRLAVELPEQDAGLSPRGSRFRIDSDPLHRPKVDDQRVVGDRQPWEAVAAAADGDLHPRSARELDGRDHVGDAGAARDQGGTAADRAVPDAPLLVVERVARPHQLAA